MDGHPTSIEAAPTTAPATRQLAVHFTGSGAEYFRIWAVNVLLVLLTLGLYLPLAKARRLRYVHANTWVDGEALAFHGDPWRMFRGFLMLAVLAVAYLGAGEFAPAASAAVLLMLYAVWPALWRASMQYRLANTSWRGLRMGFEGSLHDAYLCFLPVYVPLTMSALLDGAMASHGPSTDPALNTGLWGLVSGLALSLTAPWTLTLAKRYQHGGYRIADQRLRIRLQARSVYFIGFKSAMLGFFASLVVMAAGFALGSLLGLALNHGAGLAGSSTYVSLMMVLLFGLFYGGVLTPYAATRLQNLTWSNTRSDGLRFESSLDGWALVHLTVRNWLLILLTAGLYRPSATMATLRLRLEAIGISVETEPDHWLAPKGVAHADAAGEAAGDFFGMDLGL